MKDTSDAIPAASGQSMLPHAARILAVFDAHDLRLLAASPDYYAFLDLDTTHEPIVGRPLLDLMAPLVASNLLESCQQVVQTGRSSCLALAQGNETSNGFWMIDPVGEPGDVSAVVLTLSCCETQRAVPDLRNTQRQLQFFETLLGRVHHLTEPHTFAQAVLQALETPCAASVLAFYQVHPHAETLSLLATQGHAQQVATLFPAQLSPWGAHAFWLQAFQQRAPLISRVGNQPSPASGDDAEVQAWLARAELAWAIVVPLVCYEQAEGLLILGGTSSSPTTCAYEKMLAQSAPYLAERLAYQRRYAPVAQQRQRLNTVMDQLPEGIVIVDARTGTIRYANPTAADLLGSTLPHLIGAPLNHSVLWSPVGLSGTQKQAALRWNFALIHALWGQVVTNQELRIPLADGSERVVLSSAAPIRAASGQILEAVILFQDLTAVKEAAHQQSAFFAMANHELRTPLTVITNVADVLQLRLSQDSDELTRQAMTCLIQECEQLLRLSTDLASLDPSGWSLARRDEDLLPLLHNLVSTWGSLFPSHPLCLRWKGEAVADQLVGCFDLLRLKQVMTNLLSNARKYSAEGEEIEVGVRVDQDNQRRAKEVLVWVKDHGRGISAEQLPHLFERFYRADPSDHATRGFGIGLYVSREIVRGHGGRIWAESVLGQGSTFFVALPLREAC